MRRRAIFGIPGLFPLGAALVFVAVAHFGYHSDRVVFFLIVAPFFVAARALRYQAHAFLCPRCGKRFAQKALVSIPHTKRCLTCGIVIGTPKS